MCPKNTVFWETFWHMLIRCEAFPGAPFHLPLRWFPSVGYPPRALRQRRGSFRPPHGCLSHAPLHSMRCCGMAGGGQVNTTCALRPCVVLHRVPAGTDCAGHRPPALHCAGGGPNRCTTGRQVSARARGRGAEPFGRRSSASWGQVVSSHAVARATLKIWQLWERWQAQTLAGAGRRANTIRQYEGNRPGASWTVEYPTNLACCAWAE